MDLDNCWACVLSRESAYMCMVCPNSIISINAAHCHDAKGCMFELVSVYPFNAAYFKLLALATIGPCAARAATACGDNSSCSPLFKRFDSLLSLGVLTRFTISKCGAQ